MSSKQTIISLAVTLGLLAGLMGQVAEANSGVGGGSKSPAPAPKPPPPPAQKPPPPPAPKAPPPAPAPAPKAAPAPAPQVQAPTPKAAPMQQAATAARPSVTSPAPAPAMTQKQPADSGVGGGSRTSTNAGAGVAAQSQMAKIAERNRAVAAGAAAGLILHEREKDEMLAKEQGGRQSRDTQSAQASAGHVPGVTRAAPTPQTQVGQDGQYRDRHDRHDQYYGGGYQGSPGVVVIDRSPAVIVQHPPVVYSGGGVALPGNNDWRPTVPQSRAGQAADSNDGEVGKTLFLTFFGLAVLGLACFGGYRYYVYREGVKNLRGKHSLS